MSDESGPGSPCVSVCALDENDLCIGCLRSGDEIALWGSMSSQDKIGVLRKVAEREEASTFGIEIRRPQ